MSKLMREMMEAGLDARSAQRFWQRAQSAASAAQGRHLRVLLSRDPSGAKRVVEGEIIEASPARIRRAGRSLEMVFEVRLRVKKGVDGAPDLTRQVFVSRLG